MGLFETPDGQLEAILRLGAAAVFGAIIGLDRASRDKPADVRTFALVSVGAALFTLVGLLAFGPGDPASRVAAQIVTGIGFLGAGTILHFKRHVVGLTTAAGVWAVAAVGMAFGGGLWVLAVGASVLIVVVLRLTGLESAARTGLSEDGPQDAPVSSESEPGSAREGSDEADMD